MTKEPNNDDMECIIDGEFSGGIRYSCSGMRSPEEVEHFTLEKGDKVYIKRAKLG